MTLNIDLPDNLCERSPEELRFAFAAQLYGAAEISSGQAAEIAGVSRIEFLENVGRYGVPVFDMTDEEVKRDIRNANPDYHG